MLESGRIRVPKEEKMSQPTHTEDLSILAEMAKTPEGREEIARMNAQSVAQGIDELPNKVHRQEKMIPSKAEQLAALRAELEIARSVASEVDGRVPTTGPTEIERLERQIETLEN